MKLMQPLRVWWQKQTGEEETPFDGDTPAWVISLFVHLGLLILLTIVSLAGRDDNFIIVLATETQEEPDERTPEEFYFSEVPTPEIGANSMSGEEAAMAEAAIVADFSEVPTPEIEAEVGEVVVETTFTVASAPNFNANTMVRGTATGVGATGAAGAIDRITHEIILSLEQRKTLVVWLLDESLSMKLQREQIRDRIDRIYYELGVIEESGNSSFAQHDDKPLLTSVVSFCKTFTFLTPQPTDDIQKIKTAIDNVPEEHEGIEYTFTAVHEVAKKYVGYRTQEKIRRNVMIIVLTDEAGDDQQKLDETVDYCRKYQMPVYVIGVPAPFGRKEVDIKWVDPDPQYSQEVQWLPVSQGPETFLPERIKLHFSGVERDAPIDSGFGPYALTRLAVETGGIYFAVHPNRNEAREVGRRETAELAAHLAHFFNPAIMKRYQPEYVSVAEYQRLVGQNKAKEALIRAAQISWADNMTSPRLNFPKVNEADFANLLSQAQQQAAKVEPKVDQIYQMLSLGEKDRPNVREPRWQAGYDLAMGRTLAVMVRTKTYNAMLAKAKQGMKFEDEKNDTWELKPSDTISVGSVLEKQAKQAREYLESTVREHEGTPWAMLAERELKEPLGWEWKETYTGVNAPRQGNGGNGNANPANDQRRMMQKPKPVRKPVL